jgi:hypothetical protein
LGFWLFLLLSCFSGDKKSVDIKKNYSFLFGDWHRGGLGQLPSGMFNDDVQIFNGKLQIFFDDNYPESIFMINDYGKSIRFEYFSKNVFIRENHEVYPNFDKIIIHNKKLISYGILHVGYQTGLGVNDLFFKDNYIPSPEIVRKLYGKPKVYDIFQNNQSNSIDK